MAEFTLKEWQKMSELEQVMSAQLQDAFPSLHIESQYKFHPKRKWLSDFAISSLDILIECEGGTYSKKKGAHVRPVKYGLDCLKYNTAGMMGWLVLRFDTKHINDGIAISMIKQAVKEKQHESHVCEA